MTSGATSEEGNGPFSIKGGTRRWLYILPVAVFVVLVGFFAFGLTLDPSKLPSALIGQEVPTFDLPPIDGRPPGLSSKDLKGRVSVVNVFASWCTACREEHPVWMSLRDRSEVPFHGLNYKDETGDALAWLSELGDPYDRVGADSLGRVSIDFGVYGVPETFVIDAAGRVAHRHVGAMDRRTLETVILPLVKRLRTEAPPRSF